MSRYAEQIAAYENKRAATFEAMNKLQKSFDEKGESMDATADEEFQNYKLEIDACDKQIERYRDLEKLSVATAKQVIASDDRTASESRKPGVAVAQVKRNLPQGMLFTRMTAAKICSYLDHRPAYDVAKDMFPDTPEVSLMLRAAVASGNTTDSTWAGPLVQLQNEVGMFLDLLRPATIVGRIPGLVSVPFNTQIPRATLDPTAYWVGQGQIKPVSAGAFDSISLTFAKAAGIVVLTEELVRFSRPNADTLMQRALVNAVTYLTDRTFVDPTAAATGSSPASITNGVTAVAPTGTTADAFRDDLGTMLSNYDALEIDTANLILVMRPSQARFLGMMRNSLGVREFPDISQNGGVVEGVSVITSGNIPAAGGSPTDGYPIIGLIPEMVLLADDGSVNIDMSREASLQMDSAPDSPLTASTITRNLWQHNEIAIKAERFITWKVARTGAVQYIQGARYQ